MKKILMMLMILCFAMISFSQDRIDCSLFWCAYNDLKKESIESKGDYTTLININTRIEKTIIEAKKASSQALYALELLLANNLVKMDNTAEAIEHFQLSYNAANPEKRKKIGYALWFAHKSVADKLLRNKTDLPTAREHYLWLVNNKELISADLYEKIEEQIKFGLKMTK